MGDEFGSAVCHGYGGGVAEVAFGGGEVEPVVMGEFCGDETGHGRFMLDPEESPNRLTNPSDSGSGGE